MPASSARVCPRAPVLVLVSGLPGVGKSLLVQNLAPRLEAASLSRDAARLGLYSGRLRHLVEASAWRLAGRRLASTQRRARRALELAIAEQLEQSRSAIVEAVADPPLRERLRELAVHHGATFVQVECVLSDSGEHHRRLAVRAEGERFWRRVTGQIQSQYQAPAQCLRIDTAGPPDELAEHVLAAVLQALSAS